MESNKILKADVLDIIFENKNKQYGAYELRKNYHRRARKSVTLVAIFACIASGIPLLAGLLIKDEGNIRSLSRNIQVISDIPKLPETKIEHPQTNHRPTAAVKAPTPPVVTQTETMRNDEQPEEKENGPTGPVASEGPDEGPASIDPGPGKASTDPVVIEEPKKKETIFETETLHQYPEFPGGEDAMAAFLKSHLKYPKRAIEAGENGKVTLEFVVDTDGSISDISFLRKGGFGFDEEAKRVVSMMPPWKPGKINGQPVKARYQIPIFFVLED